MWTRTIVFTRVSFYCFLSLRHTADLRYQRLVSVERFPAKLDYPLPLTWRMNGCLQAHCCRLAHLRL